MPLARLSEHGSWSSFVAAHRMGLPRRRLGSERILVFSPDAKLRRWVEHETFGEPQSIEFVDALADIVASLTLVPPPWPRFLIVDADAISSAEAHLLVAIREAGWSGQAIAVGDASKLLQRSLGIDAIVPRTLDSELLRNALRQVRSARVTIPMRRIAR